MRRGVNNRRPSPSPGARSLLLVVLLLSAVLAACGEEELSADSECRDFLQASADDQNAAVARAADELDVSISVLGRPNIDNGCLADQDQTLGEVVGRFGEGGSATGPDDQTAEDDEPAGSEDPDVEIAGSPITLEGLGDSAAAGSAVVAERGEDERVLIVQAQGLEATPQNPTEEDPGFAYEVWLYNSDGDAVSLGAQLTDEQGNLQGAAPLPDDFKQYRFVDVSREPIDSDESHSGDSVMRGDIDDLTSSAE